ncbi:MAG: hypothetical protein JWO92_417 [Chitinophagaceae bacterium]|nr:hypothetical protein [Chitinophagaceae bacterium]
MAPHKISRRRVLQLGMPAAGIIYAGGLAELFSSCKNKTAQKDNGAANNHPGKPKKTPVQRGNPYAGRDEMFLHNKTKALHYPYVFKTYDKLREEHVTPVNTNDWEKQLDENGAHFTKEKSALIFERLALKNLSADVNNENLNRSAAILGRSFKTGYVKQNIHNWRGYHLLLQLITLNSAVAEADKWATFSNAIKDADISQIKKIPKRNAWIASQQLFEQRVQYIHQHTDEYMNRIKKRMA